MHVSRAGYYRYIDRPKSKRMTMWEKMLDIVKEIHEKHKVHGYRWINAILKRKEGIVVSNNYVWKCCHALGIKSESSHQRWRKPREQGEKYSNLIMSDWRNVTKPFQVIVSDMTCFYSRYNYYELTLYFDVCTKMIVGASLSSKRGDRRTYIEGLNQILEIIKEESHEPVTILHTDQGSVYSSKNYNELLKDYNISRSMSRPGTPTDNPVNESLNGWIKDELFIDFDLKNSKDVFKTIRDYIDFYNNERPSYALAYEIPAEVMKKLNGSVPKLRVSHFKKDFFEEGEVLYTIRKPKVCLDA